MELNSRLNTPSQARSTMQTWDKCAYTKLVEDTDEETAQLIWQAFGRALAESIREWTAAASAKDSLKIRQIAHRIRSSSLLLGFLEFARLSQKIEHDLINNISASGLDQDLDQWLNDGNSVLEILKRQPQDLLR